MNSMSGVVDTPHNRQRTLDKSRVRPSSYRGGPVWGAEDWPLSPALELAKKTQWIGWGGRREEMGTKESLSLAERKTK